MIRCSKHSLKFANSTKQQQIRKIIFDYRNLVQNIIDYIWANGYKNFNISKDLLNCPSLIDSSFLKNFKSEYTERLKQAAGKQALMMISAATEKRRKQIWQLHKLQEDNCDVRFLQKTISDKPLVKPQASKINLELDSRFVDFKFDNQKKFLGYIRLSSIKKSWNIKIPIVYSKVFDKWNNIGSLKKSIRLSDSYINLIFDVKEPNKKDVGKIVSCDQGITTMLTFSDNQTVPKYQNKYSLKDVQQILSRKKKGSKAFKRAQEFRKNLINWSINQLNFNDIKEIKLEKLYQVGKGQRRSRFLSHWTYTLINNKLKRVSEEKGFLITEVPNEFRSQRCSNCGWVRKNNRKGKVFCCNKCKSKFDADLNASYNLLLDLYEIPYWVRMKKINIEGFYWKSDGLYSECHELIVHDAQKE